MKGEKTLAKEIKNITTHKKLETAFDTFKLNICEVAQSRWTRTELLLVSLRRGANRLGLTSGRPSGTDSATWIKANQAMILA